jgi:hypothetical protein
MMLMLTFKQFVLMILGSLVVGYLFINDFKLSIQFSKSSSQNSTNFELNIFMLACEKCFGLRLGSNGYPKIGSNSTSIEHQ